MLYIRAAQYETKTWNQWYLGICLVHFHYISILGKFIRTVQFHNMYKKHIFIAKNVQKRRVKWEQKEAELGKIMTKKTTSFSFPFYFNQLKPCQIIIAKYMCL